MCVCVGGGGLRMPHAPYAQEDKSSSMFCPRAYLRMAGTRGITRCTLGWPLWSMLRGCKQTRLPKPKPEPMLFLKAGQTARKAESEHSLLP